MKIRISLVLLVLLLSACGQYDVDLEHCENVGNVQAVCGIERPEDLALLPDGYTLLVSQYGSMFDYRPGSLALLDTRTDTVSPLAFNVAAELWVNQQCPGMPGAEFSPHGIHFSQRADGRWQLLVVNHGGRESVEFFEVDSGEHGYSLSWRGCVRLPENHFANSVVATPEGGFIYSHMFAKNAFRVGTTAWPTLKAVFGVPSGYAVEWTGRQIDGGDMFKKIAGSETGFPNGVELSADGRYLFLNASVDGYVHKINRAQGRRVASSAKLPHLDNIRWDGHGQLLVASMTTGLFASVRCLEISSRQNCGGAYNIVRVDPADMSSEVLYQHQGGPPLGAATVALPVGDYLYIGSYAGNGLAKVSLGRQ